MNSDRGFCLLNDRSMDVGISVGFCWNRNCLNYYLRRKLFNLELVDISAVSLSWSQSRHFFPR